MEESPETIYKHQKDADRDLEKAKKRNRGLGRVVRRVLDLRPDRKEKEAQLMHDNQRKLSEAYFEMNSADLREMAEQEDQARLDSAPKE